MRNHEILEKGPLLENGNIKEPGWSKELLLEYNRHDIKAPKWRIKEWDYYLVMNKDFAVALTLSDLGYIGMLSASFIDFTVPYEHTNSIITALPMGKFNLPSTSKEGLSEYQDKRLTLKFDVKDNQRHLVCHFKKFEGDKDLICDIVLDEPKQDSLVIATPFDKQYHFYYNQKINCLPASGYVRFDGNEYYFNKETDFGTFDWGRGVWTYDNYWYWGSGSGYVNNEPVGFNIGYGFGNTKAASENVIFYKGKAHKFDDLTFNIPSDSYLNEWTFTSSDGRFETTFTPIIDRAACTDLKVIVSDQHQVFGKMNGTFILDDGTQLEIKDFLCFAEKVHNKY